LVYCSKKNLAPLHDTCRKEKTIHSQGIGWTTELKKWRDYINHFV
jgi:hypothetical protein